MQSVKNATNTCDSMKQIVQIKCT